MNSSRYLQMMPGVSVLLLAILSVPIMVQEADAALYLLDNTTCINNLGGVWDSNSNTCTLLGSTTFYAGDVLQVPANTALINYGTFTSSGHIIVDSGGTIDNTEGTIITECVGVCYDSEGREGYIDNYGLINNSNNGKISHGGDRIKNWEDGVIDNNAGGEIYIDDQAALDNNRVGSTINNVGGTIVVDDGALTSSGFIDNKGGTILITNDGELDNSGASVISNVSGGIITIENDSICYCDGLIINTNGNIYNHAKFSGDGQVTNSGGTIINYPGADFENYNNSQSNMIVNTSGGLIKNSGILQNWSPIFNTDGATIINTSTGIIENRFASGIITNSDPGSTIKNHGTIDNISGTISNIEGATILNDETGTINNHVNGEMINTSGATMENHGQTINDGTMENSSSGTTLINSESGVIINDNSGYINNDSDAEIKNEGVLTNKFANTRIDNNSIISNEPGGSIQNDSGGEINNYDKITNCLGTVSGPIGINPVTEVC